MAAQGQISSLREQLQKAKAGGGAGAGPSVDKAIETASKEAAVRLVVGEYTFTTYHDFLLLPIASGVSCPCVDALLKYIHEAVNFRHLPPSPAISQCLPMSTPRLSFLPNPHRQRRRRPPRGGGGARGRGSLAAAAGGGPNGPARQIATVDEEAAREPVRGRP